MNNPLEGLDIASLTGTGTIGQPTDSVFDIKDVVDDKIEDVVDDVIIDDEDDLEESAEIVSTPSIGFKNTDKDGGDPVEGLIKDNSLDNEEIDILSTFSESGIIEISDEDETPEDERDLEWFVERAKEKSRKEIKSGIDEYKDTLPDEIKDLLERYEDGVPLGSILKREREAFDFSSITEEKIEKSESLQKKLYSDALALRGESEEDIEELVQEAEDSGLLEKHAIRSRKKIASHMAHQEQIEREGALRQRQTQKENYNNWLTSLKSDIKEKEEIIPGLKMNDVQRKKLYEGITKLDKDGKNAVARYREKDPNFDLQVAYLATVLEGDFSSLQAAIETKATKKLRDKANSNNKSGAGKTRSRLKGVDFSIMKKFI